MGPPPHASLPGARAMVIHGQRVFVALLCLRLVRVASARKRLPGPGCWLGGAVPAGHYIAIIWQTHAKFGRLMGRSACRAICCRQRVGLACQRRLFRQGAQPAQRQLPGPWGTTGVVPEMTPSVCPCAVASEVHRVLKIQAKMAVTARLSFSLCYQNRSISMAAIAAIRRPMPPALRNAAPPWPSTRCGTPACSTCAAATAARTTHPASRLPG